MFLVMPEALKNRFYFPDQCRLGGDGEKENPFY